MSRDPRIKRTHKKIQEHMQEVDFMMTYPHGCRSLLETEQRLRRILDSNVVSEMPSASDERFGFAFGYHKDLDFCKFLTNSIGFHHALTLKTLCQTPKAKEFELQCKFTTVDPKFDDKEGVVGVTIKKYMLTSVYDDGCVKVFTRKYGEQDFRIKRLSFENFYDEYPFKASSIMLMQSVGLHSIHNVMRCMIKDV